MVCLPGGAFMYGNAFPEEGYAADGESVPVRVHVAQFAVDATEVTNQQFSAFVNATGHSTGTRARRCARAPLCVLLRPICQR
jgi:sulfatase modifying factor 1